MFELPFMAASAEATSQAVQEFYETHLQDEYEDVHVLMLHTHAPGTFHIRDRAVEEVSDLEGLKVRAPTRVINGALEQLGAVPVGMPVPQVPEALSRGVVDATVIPWEVARPLRVHELVDHHTEFDADRGLGTIRSDTGDDHEFHCVEIADGSRDIPIGAEVTFEILPKFGRYEAADIRS